MKRILFVLFACSFISANGQVENDIMHLIKEDNTVFIDTSILLVSDTNRRVGLREHGVWRTRSRTGELLFSVRSYYGGNAHGQSINFSNNRIINSIYYYNGIKHGPYIAFWHNGKPKYQMFYKEGKLNGIAKDFDTTGRLEKIERYKDGKKEGMEVSLYPSGNIKYLKNYINSKENGVRKVYRDIAVLELIAEYVVENGKVISEKVYDKEALPIEIPLKIDGNVHPEGN